MTLLTHEHGPGNAQTIVLIHGGGNGSWMWDPQVECLARDYHCLVPVLPGHDGTPMTDPYTVEALADQVAGVIRTRAHGGRAHAVGLSLGAQVLTGLLTRHPELVDRAVLSGCLTQKLPGAGLLGLSLRLTDPFKRVPAWIRANMKQTGVPDTYYAQFARDSATFAPAILAAVFRANLGYGMPAGMDRVTAPVLVAVGEKEKRVMHDSARRLAAAIPGAQAVVSPGVGHAWNLQEPERFTSMVRAFLEGRPLPPALRPLEC